MSNNYAPCFNRTYFVLIHAYIELPWSKQFVIFKQSNNINEPYSLESPEGSKERTNSLQQDSNVFEGGSQI